jgi:ribosome-associated translation inhibitor RaiA
MNMKTTVRYLSLNAQAAWHRQVEDQLKHLHGLTAITAAEVVLEHQREAKPAFRVQVRLEVPGPGTHAKATRHTRKAALLIHGPALHAEARDNTLEAALLKATQDLEHQAADSSRGVDFPFERWLRPLAWLGGAKRWK